MRCIGRPRRRSRFKWLTFRSESGRAVCSLGVFRGILSAKMSFCFRFSAPISKEHRSRLIRHLSTWDFEPHRLSEADLYRSVCLVFEAVFSIEGLRQLNISMGELWILTE